jgi:hypothetical protein
VVHSRHACSSTYVGLVPRLASIGAMAEPFSIIGLISASVSLVDRVCGYLCKFHDAPKHAAKLAEEVTATGTALKMLQAHLLDQNSKGGTLDRTSVLFFSVNGCAQRLKEIEKKLLSLVSGSKGSQFIHRLKWPLEKDDADDAVAALNRYSHLFHFALTLDRL